MSNGRPRPSDKELLGKIRSAKTALAGSKRRFVDPGKVVSELEYLDVETKEVWPLIDRLLDEICPDDYSGMRPPMKAYEKSIEGEELFAFSWDSHELMERFYLKFALKDGFFIYVSLHPDRPPKKRN